MSDRRKRANIKSILDDPEQRRHLMIQTIIATQAREGIETTWEQAADAYDKIQEELKRGHKLKERIGNPGQPSLARNGASGIAAAEKTFHRFHNKKPGHGVYPFHKNSEGIIALDDIDWPENVCFLGEAMRTLYESDKWHDRGKTTQYYHDHDPGIVSFMVPSGRSSKHGELDLIELPYEWPAEVTLIGACIGFVVRPKSTGQITEGVMKGQNILVCSPDGWVDSSRPNRVFLAIINLDGGGVEAVIDGGNLRITSHGIEG